MPGEKERNIAMMCRKKMVVSQDDMWLLVSASNLLFQTQVVLLFQIWQQHQSNQRALTMP